jgi:hypothetical protein
VKQVLTQDGLDLLDELTRTEARFLVVGGHALAVHGVSRATVDLDVLVEPTADNAARVVLALQRFGAPLQSHGVTEVDFARPGAIYQIGLPPNRIDVLTELSGVTFEQAWSDRVLSKVDGVEVPFLGLATLRENKRASGRTKDLADLELLDRLSPR